MNFFNSSVCCTDKGPMLKFERSLLLTLEYNSNLLNMLELYSMFYQFYGP